MASSPHTGGDEIINVHSEVGEMIKERLIPEPRVPEDVFHCWAAVAVVFARSRNFARSIGLLLDKAWWEGAAPLVRTLFEDAAVLAYIHAQDERAERFAHLYLLSDAPWRLRYRSLLGAHGIRSDLETPAAVRQLETNNEKFCALREKLCKDQLKPGGPYQRNPNSWNYLTIADTFRSAGLDMQYDCCYAPLSDLLHSSAYAVSYAFQQHLTPASEIDQGQEQDYKLWIEKWFILALGMQLCYTSELLDVRPKTGLPDLGALMDEAAHSTEYEPNCRG